MIWGVGTGRCGTLSLATQLGGVHEPGKLDVIQYLDYGGRAMNLLLVCEELARRRDMNVPIVVDPRHSYVIPVIKEVDPDARFLWIFRNPVDTIRSWLARGNWQGGSDDAESRYSPRGGYPKGWVRLQKGIWFWREINARIRRDLMECFEVWECPYDLEVHENNSPERILKRFEEWEVDLISDGTMCLYQDLQNLREATRGLVL